MCLIGSGSLLTRNLADLVKKENFVLDSEYLTTLLVVVPKSSFNDWKNRYEQLSDMVVPRSSKYVVLNNTIKPHFFKTSLGQENNLNSESRG